MPSQRFFNDLNLIAEAYYVNTSDDWRYVQVEGFLLPPGYNYQYTEVLITVPRDYPLSPPGVGNSPVYLRPDLRFQGRVLKDLHAGRTPGWGPWAWCCYEHISWNASHDDLVTFLEMLRANLTNPNTR